ncbi:hypothetical protein M0P65_07755 [Candidatus Gracilibacteria bacterium]|jgi:hypothetical protein|nr:hypothetical protein [Candidatus Gracilibacteria bacterium]
MKMDYKQLYWEEGFGSYGGFGIEIKIATTTEIPDLKCSGIFNARIDAVDLIKAAVYTEMIKNDPNTPIAIEENKELLNLFSDPIYVEEIPNGYCDKYCCKHLPWFDVTTKIGRIKIGWRKRVIHIEWTGTKNKINAKELFLDEDTTKFDKIIHAWSMEKAKEYIDKIIENT